MARTGPVLARDILELYRQQLGPAGRIEVLERRLMAWHRASSRRLAAIPGIGPITATALVMKVPNRRHSTPPATSHYTNSLDTTPTGRSITVQPAHAPIRTAGADLQASRSRLKIELVVSAQVDL